MNSNRFVSLALMLLLSLPLTAADYQPHQSILDAARELVRIENRDDTAALDISTTPLDRRLRLTRCDQPLEAFAGNTSKRGFRRTVGIRCNGDDPWSIYVPVSVEKRKKVLVASRPLARGALISQPDIKLEVRELSKLHQGYSTDPKQIVNHRLKRDLPLGAPISPRHLSSVDAVRRGSLVTILGQLGSIQVRMEGKAMGRGNTGDRIKVQNSSSKRTVEGTVIGPGVVRVTL